MPTQTTTLMRRYLRFDRYLPVRCTALRAEQPDPRALAGKTLNVGTGGLALLLPETLPLGIRLLVQVGQGDPLLGRVVWVSRAMPTLRGTTFPHGVAFEQPVDPALVRQWVSDAKRRVHPRVPVQFGVEYTHAGRASHGTWFNLSQGGMFIATERPPPWGTEVSLHFTPPGLTQPLSIRARVAWMCTEEGASAVTGMGLQFVEPKQSDTAVIASIIDRLRSQASRPSDSSWGFPHSR